MLTSLYDFVFSITLLKNSSAVCADNTVSLGAVNGVINLLAGQNTSYAVSGSGFGYSGKTRFYCGQNAGSLSRKSAFRYAGSYPYARIQPKLVVITLDANGGAIGDSTIATLSLLQTDDNTFTLKNSAQPFRNGYAFNGWNTAADGSGESYTAGQTYTAAEDAEIQLFAQW